MQHCLRLTTDKSGLHAMYLGSWRGSSVSDFPNTRQIICKARGPNFRSQGSPSCRESESAFVFTTLVTLM